MLMQQPFEPAYGTGFTVAPSATSSSVPISLGSVNLCITSLNNVLCYVRITKGASNATIADYPVPPNQQIVLTKDRDLDTLSFIAPAGGGSLHIIAGEGY